MIAGCDRFAPPEDPRDALIREQAQRIAVQAERIAVLEAMVAGGGTAYWPVNWPASMRAVMASATNK